jgi:hypothetical protein
VLIISYFLLFANTFLIFDIKYVVCYNKCNDKHLKGEKMEPKDYTVIRIEGEYAILSDDETKEELFIAMALLPLGVDVGSRLHYEMLEYTLVE